MGISKINKNLTLENLKEEENLYFDRKSSKVDLKSLANEIASFANANGGVIAVGITDNGDIEGFNNVGISRLNEIQKVVTTYLKPCPIYECELIEVKNIKSENDHIVLFHIEPSMNFVVRNKKDEVYCRQGDSSIKLTHDQIKNLEYDRKERNFENEIIIDSSIDDIDDEIVQIYKNKIITDLDNISVLKARGYLREINGTLKFTNAGMLLFGKNPSIYMPWARLRVLKFEGNEFQVGTSMNIVKEKTFDKNLYRGWRQNPFFL